MSKSVSVQIGQISERNPDGTFRSALPITREVTPEVKGCKEAGVDQP